MNDSFATDPLDDGWQPMDDDTFIGHVGSVYTRPAGALFELGILTGSRHQNMSGMVHGGVMMTVFDRAMGGNVRDMRAGERFATASMTVDFLRQVRVGEFIRLTSFVTKAGRKAVFMRGEAHVGDRLVGAASAIFMAVA
jgi:acyl-coenzyme A thioesterase PaaI-like protein